jgi:hypothetical protein
MADPLRHRQTKGAATDMVDLTPPRHIPTLPGEAIRGPSRSSTALDPKPTAQTGPKAAKDRHVSHRPAIAISPPLDGEAQEGMWVHRYPRYRQLVVRGASLTAG